MSKGFSNVTTHHPSPIQLATDQVENPVHAPVHRAWGPVAAVAYGFLFAVIGVQLLAGIILAALVAEFGGGQTLGTVADSTVGRFVIITLFEFSTFAAIILFAHKKLGAAAWQVLGFDRFKWRYILVAIGGLLTYYAIYIVTISICKALIPALNLEQQQDLGFMHPKHIEQYAMIFVSLVVLPPLVEETVFRGFILQGLRQKLRIGTAAVVTSILFAIGHLQIGNGQPLLWAAAIDTFVLSLVLCVIRYKTGSLWPTIMVHALKNAVAFMLLYTVAK